MEGLIRSLEHRQRTKTELRPKPSEAFARQFGVDHGIDLSAPVRFGYTPLSPSSEGEESQSRSYDRS